MDSVALDLGGTASQGSPDLGDNRLRAVEHIVRAVDVYLSAQRAKRGTASIVLTTLLPMESTVVFHSHTMFGIGKVQPPDKRT